MSAKKPRFKQHTSNYNYKPKRSFGQRIKNFFTMSEEDLKEEPSKEFEKIKLFTLTRGSLFLGILVFMILINILVGFNINFLYLRQILGFLFLILIPGLLIMLCFKIRTVKFWEYLVYTVGLSIAFIMFAGLAVNWTLPALNITDKPLSLWPILICFDLFLLGLWLTAIYRNRDLKPFDITIPKLDAINRIFFIIPMIFPLLSILGAFLLNNHGPNILTMIMLGGIAVYVLLLVIFRKHMNENVWPWALYWMGLALLLMFSMRSWYVTGWDIFQEQLVFQLANNNSFWNISLFKSSYNTCLSITILPTILFIFIKTNTQYIFKFLFPILFSLVCPIIFLLNKKYFSIFISFISVFSFIIPIGFMGMVDMARQEIALLFFTLMILILFTDKISLPSKKLIFVLFGASMIVSHYSTSFIVLALFALVWIMILLYKINEKNKISKGKLFESERSKFYLTGILIFLLLIFGFLWNSQITKSSDSLIDTFKQSFNNLGYIFNEEFKEPGSSLLNQFNVFYKPENLNRFLQEYSEEVRLEYEGKSSINRYSSNEYKEYTPKIVYSMILPKKVKGFIFDIYLLEKLLKIFIKLFIFIGISSFLFSMVNRRKIDKEYFLISLGYTIIIGIILILPILSTRYPLGRLYQQALIILSLFCVMGGIFLFKMFKSNTKKILVTLIFILFFTFSYGFIPQLIGGVHPPSPLNNFGEVYSQSYSHKSEASSAIWFSINYDNKSAVYADRYSTRRLFSFANHYKSITDVLPLTLDKRAYVYANYANTVQKRASQNYKGRYLNYNFPSEFLHSNKNNIYNNGGSEIFK